MKGGKVPSNWCCKPCLNPVFDFFMGYRRKKGQLSLAFFLLLLCCTAYCFYNSDRFISVFIAQLCGAMSPHLHETYCAPFIKLSHLGNALIPAW